MCAFVLVEQCAASLRKLRWRDGSGRRLEHRTLDGVAELTHEVAPGLLAVEAPLRELRDVGDPTEKRAVGREVDAVAEGGVRGVLDRTELRRDQDGLVLDDPLALLVEENRTTGVAGVLGLRDLELELSEVGHRQGVADAGHAEQQVTDVTAGPELVDVEDDALLSVLAGCGLDVLAVLHTAVRGDLELGVGDGDELVRVVGRGAEGVEVDLALEAEATGGLRGPHDVADDDAAERGVVGADRVEVLAEVDGAAVGAEGVVHDVFPSSHM